MNHYSQQDDRDLWYWKAIGLIILNLDISQFVIYSLNTLLDAEYGLDMVLALPGDTAVNKADMVSMEFIAEELK